MRNAFWVWAVLACVGCAGDVPNTAQEQPPPTVIAGHVVDDEGQGLAGVTVALLDQSTGQPIVIGGRRLVQALEGPEGGVDEQKLDAWTVEITNEAGHFIFQDVKPGTYRLVAQSWHDWDRQAKREVVIPAVTEVWRAQGQVVHLRGIAEEVVVPSTGASDLRLDPVGSGVLRLEEKNSNGGYIAVLSTQPIAADPILYFMGWNKNFLTHGLATNHAPKVDPMIYRGLPPGELHVAMFFYDNSPGSAAGSVTIKPGETARLMPHAVAVWSNGRKDPPQHLLPLMNILIENDWEAADILGEPPNPQHPKYRGLLAFGDRLEAWGPLDRQVELPDGTTVTVGDLMAASAYRKLQQFKRR